MPQKLRRIWDPVVRLAHWTFVFGCAAAFLTEEARTAHRAVGYAVMAALVVRLLWGFVGNGHARFASFVRGPREVVAYTRAMLRGEEPYFEGHNPLGAVMILTLLALLAVITVSGWMTTLDAFWGEEWVEELHATSAELLLWLVPLHVAGVVFASIRHRENLVVAMITGHKPPRPRRCGPAPAADLVGEAG